MYKAQLAGYAKKGGVLCMGLFDPDAFDAQLWVEAVNGGKRRLVQKSRNGAYNPGNFSAPKGSSALEALGERLPTMIASLRAIAKELAGVT